MILGTRDVRRERPEDPGTAVRFARSLPDAASPGRLRPLQLPVERAHACPGARYGRAPRPLRASLRARPSQGRLAGKGRVQERPSSAPARSRSGPISSSCAPVGRISTSSPSTCPSTTYPRCAGGSTSSWRGPKAVKRRAFRDRRSSAERHRLGRRSRREDQKQGGSTQTVFTRPLRQRSARSSATRPSFAPPRSLLPTTG